MIYRGERWLCCANMPLYEEKHMCIHSAWIDGASRRSCRCRASECCKTHWHFALPIRRCAGAVVSCGRSVAETDRAACRSAALRRCREGSENVKRRLLQSLLCVAAC